MRQFQYLVTLNLDEKFIEAELMEEIKKMEGISGPDLIKSLASGPMADGLVETLNKNMGDCGKSTVTAVFAGELEK